MSRTVGMLTASAVALASVSALAQGRAAEDPPLLLAPEWIRKPDFRQLETILPPQALREGVEGRAAMRCEASAEGTLRRCKVIEETPAGSGMGFAVLSLASQFRIKPTKRDGSSVEGSIVIVPVTYSMSGDGTGRRTRPRDDFQLYVADPVWREAPTRAQTAAAYPAGARASATAGDVTLECRLTSEGRLNSCVVTTEIPRSQGFGRAALSLVSLFRLDPPVDARGETPKNVRVRAPFVFSPALLTGDGAQVAKPEWGRLPEPARLASAYPSQAKAAGVTRGEVLLACGVAAQGRLDGCRVTMESPSGLGFREAALTLSQDFAMRAWTSDGRPVDGARVRIPLRFQP